MKVKDSITKETWTQETLDDGQCACVLGWIYRCYQSLSSAPEVRVKIEKEFGSAAKMIMWNDTKGRTFEEVKSLCEKLDI